MKTREQLLQDIGEAVRVDVKKIIDSRLPFVPEYVSYCKKTREAITALTEFEYEQLQDNQEQKWLGNMSKDELVKGYEKAMEND